MKDRPAFTKERAGWSDEQKIRIVEKVCQGLSGLKHPVRVIMEKMKAVPEVRIIEKLE